MKAIRVSAHGGPEVLRLEELPLPNPGPGQVRIRIQAIGVNPVDTYIRAGAYPNSQLPYTPGLDAAGIIDTVGPEVNRFKPGDRVYVGGATTGTYAELTLCHEPSVYPLPASISFEQGAALGIPYATAYRALFQKANARPGESVLIHGASGGVGVAAVQIARAAGLKVIGTSGTAPGAQLVSEHGAHHVLDHRSESFSQDLLELTGTRGVDIILEMLANVNLAKDLTLLARNGRVVVIGNRGKIEINPREIMSREATIHGVLLFNATPAELQSIHAALYAGLENGTLKPVIGKRFPLARADQAHAAVLEPGAHGKIILTP